MKLASKRSSTRIGLRKSIQRETQPRFQRILIDNDLESTVEYINSKRESKEKFISLMEAKKLKTFDLIDGTYINMYVLPDHDSQIEPWYKANDYATKLLCGEKLEYIMYDEKVSDEERLKYFANGKVLLQRVDEDNQELRMTSDSLLYLNEYLF